MSTTNTVEEIEVTTADGLRLEGRVRLPAGAPRGAVVLAHPHPSFGGTMDVWLLPRIGARLAAEGWAVLRVNFRGVGRSEGLQTGGASEHLDLMAAADAIRSLAPRDVPAAVVGWSFGAMVGLRLGTAVDAWVGVAPPTRSIPEVPLRGPVVPDVLPPRRTVIVGEHDQFFPPASVGVLRPDEIVVVAGADHFFFDRDDEVAGHVAAALAALHRDRAQSGARLGGRYVVRISPADVGARVSIRAHRPATADAPESFTDAVGHLESWTADGRLLVRKRDGTPVEIDETAMVAGKVLPPPPPRRPR